MKHLFWIYNPSILIDKRYAKEIFPLTTMCQEQKLNALTRLIILLSILNYAINQSVYSIVSCIVSLILVVGYYKKMEGFISSEAEEIMGESLYFNENTLASCSPTSPTVDNPMMNVMLTDITDNPNRCSAEDSYTSEVQEKINESTKETITTNNPDGRLFRSTDDEMQFDYSMRNFYTTPNTEIPNAQTKFAEWCYGDMPSRKDGANLEQN